MDNDLWLQPNRINSRVHAQPPSKVNWQILYFKVIWTGNSPGVQVAEADPTRHVARIRTAIDLKSIVKDSRSFPKESMKDFIF
jgi:hypothetical protein